MPDQNRQVVPENVHSRNDIHRDRRPFPGLERSTEFCGILIRLGDWHRDTTKARLELLKIEDRSMTFSMKMIDLVVRSRELCFNPVQNMCIEEPLLR